MRRIKKHAPPDSFEQWKTKNFSQSYEHFRKSPNNEIQELRKNLIEEQHKICCYCGGLIELKTHHIEHFKSQSSYPQLALDYQNLLASCQSGEHCGHYKKGKFDEKLISPLEEECEKYFAYAADGKIILKDGIYLERLKYTVETLGLNQGSLKKAREVAFLKAGVLDENLDAEEVQRLIQIYSQPDSQNELTPFCFAIIDQLNRALQDLNPSAEEQL